MYTGKLLFAQVMDHLPMHTLRRCIQRYNGNRHIKRFSCQDQYRSMAFAQLTYREKLARYRGLPQCSEQQALSHGYTLQRFSQYLGRCQRKSETGASTPILAQSLINTARCLYVDEDLGLELDATVYALDSTTIDLCLSVFPWAQFRKTKAAVKLHTLLDLRGNIPSFIHISDGKLHDVNVLDLLLPEPGAFYVMDRAYTDFERLYQLQQESAFFVIRAKSNLQFRRLYSHPVDKDTGLLCDQTVVLTGFYTAQHYPDKLRRIKYHDAETDKRFVFLTNNFSLPALTIAELYRYRWQIELFFKWIKQHLRIKSFFGTSENAVKTQVWIAVSVYVLVAIIKKRLNIKTSFYSILQILSLTVFETTPIDQMLTGCDKNMNEHKFSNQLNLFD